MILNTSEQLSSVTRYRQSFTRFLRKRGIASGVAFLFFIICLLIIIAYYLIYRKSKIICQL